jgi:hypothetical protein
MDLTPMNETDYGTELSFPGAVPDGETAAPENQPFVSMCTSKASRIAAARGWRLGKSLLTHSDTWGFIWRIDFKYQDDDSRFVSRFVCWSLEGDPAVYGTAMYHENLEPL